jgi:molybdenum cofactor synthesis domain-containing protein
MGADHQPSAAIAVIGDEILSGRTADTNINWLAKILHDRGIKLVEARVIGDDENLIIHTVKTLSDQYDMVFTTGGIGPTHDDITTVTIAKAFGVKVIRHPEADKRMQDHYRDTNTEYNAARQKMADIPEGADLIDNPVSAAPGFILGNVYVLPGMPLILQAMVENMDDRLPGGVKAYRLTVQTTIGEGTLASGLAEIEGAFNGIAIGSYPWFKPGQYGTALVVSGLIESDVQSAAEKLLDLVASFGGEASVDNQVAGGNTQI